MLIAALLGRARELGCPPVHVDHGARQPGGRSPDAPVAPPAQLVDADGQTIDYVITHDRRRSPPGPSSKGPDDGPAQPGREYPNGIRTRATAVKGRGPGPLDDGGLERGKA